MVKRMNFGQLFEGQLTLEYKDVVMDFILYIIRHYSNVTVKDFGLGLEIEEKVKRKEMNNIWTELRDLSVLVSANKLE